MQGRIQGGRTRRGPSLKLEKIWLFGVKSWFFTRNTPNIFAPPSARRNFFNCAAPPNLKSWIAPAMYLNLKCTSIVLNVIKYIYLLQYDMHWWFYVKQSLFSKFKSPLYFFLINFKYFPISEACGDVKIHHVSSDFAKKKVILKLPVLYPPIEWTIFYQMSWQNRRLQFVPL